MVGGSWGTTEKTPLLMSSWLSSRFQEAYLERGQNTLSQGQKSVELRALGF